MLRSRTPKRNPQRAKRRKHVNVLIKIKRASVPRGKQDGRTVWWRESNAQKQNKRQTQGDHARTKHDHSTCEPGRLKQGMDAWHMCACHPPPHPPTRLAYQLRREAPLATTAVATTAAAAAAAATTAAGAATAATAAATTTTRARTRTRTMDDCKAPAGPGLIDFLQSVVIFVGRGDLMCVCM